MTDRKVLSCHCKGLLGILPNQQDGAIRIAERQRLPISFHSPHTHTHTHTHIYIYIYTMAVQKVSGHFEYLENRSRGLDVTWQPVRGDLTAHP